VPGLAFKPIRLGMSLYKAAKKDGAPGRVRTRDPLITNHGAGIAGSFREFPQPAEIPWL